MARAGIDKPLWLQRTEYFWRSPIADARFQTVTDFDGVEQAAAVSRDGHFVAFQSDRDGQMDVWVTQVGSGQFHNLTPDSRPMALSLHFGFAKKTARAVATSVSGQSQRWADNRSRTLKAWLSSTGRATVRDWRITRPDPEILCSCQTAVCNPGTGLSSLRRRDSTLTFPCGRPTSHSSTLFRVPSRTNWTSGVLLQPAGSRKESRRTTGL